MADQRYEVSLCDLLDSNLDVILLDDTIAWRQDTTAVWIYIIISLFCIYLIRFISENIVANIHNETKNDFTRQKITVYTNIGLIVYLFFVDNARYFLVTLEDSALM